WYAGNGGAMALARILFGDVNPSGRLPITFPQSEDQLPNPRLPKPSAGMLDVSYPEGADVGYRWFARSNATPLFPFGFGLSYISLDIGGFAAAGGDTVSATATVHNASTRDGSEVVQLYVTPPSADGSAVARLVAFRKVRLKPGEAQTVQLAAEPRLLARFDTAAHAWHIAPGTYRVTLRR